MKKTSALEWQDLKRIAEIKGLGVFVSKEEADAASASAAAASSGDLPVSAATAAMKENKTLSDEALPTDSQDEDMLEADANARSSSAAASDRE